MVKVFFESTGETIELEDGANLQEVCEQQGIPIGCSEGVCGTCICRIKKGMEHLSKPNENEIDFIGQSGVQTERMLCQTKIQCKEASAEIVIES